MTIAKCNGCVCFAPPCDLAIKAATRNRLAEAAGSSESEATARQRIACQRAGVAYVPPAASYSSASNWDGPVEPWEGHPVDVLFSDGIPWSFRISLAPLGWIVAAIGIGSAVAILWK